jgi:hypothetical protein
MPADQVWTLAHEGRRHRVVVGGGLAHEVRWYVDDELVAERKTWDDTVTVEAADRKLVVRHSGLGTPRRATLYAVGLGGIDLVPEPGSRAAAYEARVREHPNRYAALATAGGVAKVVVPIVLALVAVRFAVRLPFPDLPHPDLPGLPALPWPSIPLPDLPDLPEAPGWVRRVLDVLKYVWPVVLAFVLARAEVRRRRAQDERRRSSGD